MTEKGRIMYFNIQSKDPTLLMYLVPLSDMVVVDKSALWTPYKPGTNISLSTQTSYTYFVVNPNKNGDVSYDIKSWKSAPAPKRALALIAGLVGSAAAVFALYL